MQSRLFDDIAPFHFQIEAASHHCVWGLGAVKTGVFAPPVLVGPVPLQRLTGHDPRPGSAFRPFPAPRVCDLWTGVGAMRWISMALDLHGGSNAEVVALGTENAAEARRAKAVGVPELPGLGSQGSPR